MTNVETEPTVLPTVVPAAQRLLWMLHRRLRRTGALNIPLVYRLEGAPDRAALASAVRAVVRRHEALRTTYHGRGSDLAPTVHREPQRDLELEVMDRGGLNADDQAVWKRVETIATEPIDPSIWPTRFVHLLGDDASYLVCVFHHMVFDGWSCGVFSADLGHAYAAIVSTGQVAFDPAPPYRRWVESLEGSVAEEQVAEEFWRSYLVDAVPLDLPWTDEANFDAAPEVVRFTIDAATLERLEIFRRAARATQFSALLTAFGLALRASGCHGDDLAIGSLFANRQRDFEETIGYLATQVCLRLRLSATTPVRDVVTNVRKDISQVSNALRVPFQRATGGSMLALGDVVFQLIAGPPHRLELGDVTSTHLGTPDFVRPRFGLAVVLFPVAEGLECSLRAPAGALGAGWLQTLADCYAHICEALPDVGDLTVAEFEAVE